MLTENEQKVVREIQYDLPVSPRPFRDIAERAGLTEDEVLRIVDNLLERGLMRRLGVALRHQHVGYRGNAMVVWNVPAARVEKVGMRLAGFREVTHCYEREPRPGWPYNVYAMVHKHSRSECRELVRRISSQIGVDDYLMLFSTRELKRASMLYFPEG